MPQLWLTYQEIADEFGGGTNEVRDMTQASGWPHKRSRDGMTRVMVPLDMMRAYFARATSRLEALDPRAGSVVTSNWSSTLAPGSSTSSRHTVEQNAA